MADLLAQGVDAAQYTTTAWIADLEAMREALGYAQWNLWGGSYGTTRWRRNTCADTRTEFAP